MNNLGIIKNNMGIIENNTAIMQKISEYYIHSRCVPANKRYLLSTSVQNYIFVFSIAHC